MFYVLRLHYSFASHGGHVFRLCRLTFGHGATQVVEPLVCARFALGTIGHVHKLRRLTFPLLHRL